MAKSTRKDGKSGTSVIEMDLPTAETVEPPPPEVPDETPTEKLEAVDSQEQVPGQTQVFETAGKAELDRQAKTPGMKKEASIGFFARMQRHQPADWEKLKCYLYRLAPITDRTAGGNPVKFLTIYREPMDEEMVLKEWGSGKYRCLLNQGREKGESIPIDRVEFEIENINFPPKVPPGEWVDDPRNRRWAWANIPDAKVAAASAQPANHGPSLGEIVSAVKTMGDMTRANQPAPPAKEESPFQKIDIVGLMEKTQAANDPGKVLQGVKEIAEIFKPQAQEKPDNTIVTLLMAQLADERKEQQSMRTETAKEAAASREREFALLKELLTKANAPTPDPVQQMALYGEMAKKLKDAFGPSEKEQEVAQSRMNGMQEFIAEGILKPFAPGVNAMLASLGQLMNLKAQQAAIQAQQQQRAPVAPAQQPGPQPRQPQPAVAQAATAPANGQTAPPSQQPQQQQTEQPQERAEVIAPDASMNKAQAEAHIIMTVLGSVAATLISYVENPELTGGDFAAWFADGTFPTGLPYPDTVSGIDALPIVKQYAPDMIKSLIQGSAPPLYARLAPTPEADQAFLKFLTEFLEYDPNAEPEAPEGEPVK